MLVTFSPAAENDLADIEEYLALRFSQANAAHFVRRIIRECLSLGMAPHRGSARYDVGSGIRTIGFERRASIVFEVKDQVVIILGIYYRGRDF